MFRHDDSPVFLFVSLHATLHPGMRHQMHLQLSLNIAHINPYGGNGGNKEMSGELDPNSIVGAFLKQNLDSLIDGTKSLFKGATDKVRLSFERTYRAYLLALFERHSKAKSFLLRGEPVPLYRFYVPLSLQKKDNTIAEAGINDILRIASNAIITGSAGCGKSMLIRHLLLDSLRTKGRVPVFVELRQFNSFEGDLHELILKTLASHKFTLDSDYVSQAIGRGHFILFLDGYDEVSPEKREHVRNCILEFAADHDKNAIVVTSRPDSELEGWQMFTLFRVAPLALPQAYSLVEKLPFDDHLKSKFLLDLKSKLFAKHQSFLSNPLLLSIMLLSYGQSATIPNKISVFYYQAYEALFERHDVLKDGFKRHLLSPLDIQDFARLFSAFCIKAYDRRKLEFTHTEALEHIEAGQKMVAIKCNKEHYLQDLIQSVCLMVQDGLQIVYSHRSFQEYFAARFICEARPGIQGQLMNKYTHSVGRDGVLSMLYEMRPDIVESNYILPGLTMLFESIKCKELIGMPHYRRLISLVFSDVRFTPDTFGFIVRDAQMLELIGFTMDKCGSLVGWEKSGNRTAQEAIAKEYFEVLGPQPMPLKDRKNTYVTSFINRFAETDGIFTLDGLRKLREIQMALINKMKLEEATLESILDLRLSG